MQAKPVLSDLVYFPNNVEILGFLYMMVVERLDLVYLQKKIDPDTVVSRNKNNLPLWISASQAKPSFSIFSLKIKHLLPTSQL